MQNILFRWLVVGPFLFLPLSTSCAGTPPTKAPFDFSKDSLAIEKAYVACRETAKNQSVVQQAECAGARKFSWDQEVNRVFQDLQGQLKNDLQKEAEDKRDSAEITFKINSLSSAQEKWPEWRDVNAGFCLDWYAGSREAAVFCQGNLNRDRAIWLLKVTRTGYE